MNDNYFFEAGGHEFEADMVDVITNYAKRTWTWADAVKFSTVQQDRFEGTDLFVLGVPIDITLAFEKKNRTRKLGAITIDGVTIDFGIRFGNHKANFKFPVLVIGVANVIAITKSNMWVVLGIIKDNIEEILDIGMDKYAAVADA